MSEVFFRFDRTGKTRNGAAHREGPTTAEQERRVWHCVYCMAGLVRSCRERCESRDLVAGLREKDVA